MQDTSLALAEPGRGMGLDIERLMDYLRRSVPGFPAGSTGVRLRQFQHGQSNPTFLVEAANPGEPMLRYVLRKKPPGKLLASAHDVEREHTVMNALHSVSFPVPRMLSLCSDPAVLGTPFYLMQHVAGRVFLDPRLPGITPAERTEVFLQTARALARLHAIRPAEVGLAAFGGKARGERYALRQVERWAQQYAAAAAAPDPAMAALAAHLRAAAPAGGAADACVVHGDYRLDNIIFDSSKPAVLAVLDWELATLGDPICDVAYLCLPYHVPLGSHAGPAAAQPALAAPRPEGIPSEEQLRGAYFEAAGREDPFRGRAATEAPADARLAPWAFYLSLGMYRMAAILEGVAARAAAGNASSASGAQVGALARLFARRALETAGLQAPSPSAAAAAITTAGGDGAGGGFRPSARAEALRLRVAAFVEQRVLPAEAALAQHASSAERWAVPAVVEELKAAARTEGLWNLWLPKDSAALLKCEAPAGLLGPGLSNEEYAHLAEVMGRSPWAPEAFNCSAPDTGNMEVLLRYGSAEQQRRWLLPLLEGTIRSCFAMTEPDVASSDATNICASVRRDGAGGLVLDGRKWWTSGACDPRCELAIFMGKSLAENGEMASREKHRQQSMVLVPMKAPGVKVVRPLTVYGYDDAPHGHAEVLFAGVRVRADEALLLGEGRGFEIAQGRLGPGRLHHCMRLLGAGGRALRLAAQRAESRVAFGRPLAHQGAFREALARAALALEQAQLATLAAAAALDAGGNKQAAAAIAMAKVAAPAAALLCIDFSVQAHGGAGVCQDTILPYLWAGARTLRIADGPDEVHLITIAKAVLARSKL